MATFDTRAWAVSAAALGSGRNRCPLDVEVVVHTGDGNMEGRTTDISVGGLGATLPSTLQHGVEVSVEFTLPDGTSVRAAALVRYAQGERHGLQFLTLGVQESDTIGAYCVSQALLARLRNCPPA